MIAPQAFRKSLLVLALALLDNVDVDASLLTALFCVSMSRDIGQGIKVAEVMIVSVCSLSLHLFVSLRAKTCYGAAAGIYTLKADR